MIASKAILLAGALSVAIAGSASAQPHDPKKGPPAKGAPAARPAPPPHPVAPPRPAAPPHIAAPPRPAPHIAAPPRPMPHIAAPPRAVPHISAPRPLPHAPSRAVRSAPRIEHAAPRLERSGPRVIQGPADGSSAAGEFARCAAAGAAAAPARGAHLAQPAAGPTRRASAGISTRAARANATAAEIRRPPCRRSRTLRRGRRARVPTASPASASKRRGRAASQRPFAGRHRTFATVAPRRAWRRGLRAGFVPWYGPVFWPYAYADIFDYTFWPHAYDDGYWAYAYDDVLDGVFFGEAGPPREYIEDADYPRAPAAARSSVRRLELCRQPGAGVTAWPFAELQNKLGLSEEQRALLGDVRAAAGSERRTCSGVLPLTAGVPAHSARTPGAR